LVFYIKIQPFGLAHWEKIDEMQQATNREKDKI